MILFSLIPSFYPVYKSLVAPSLPRWIQQFFSDVKNFFLIFFGFYLSGKSFDEVVSLVSSDPLAAVPIKISLQDWVYSYILHCNLYRNAVAFRQLCSQCYSLSEIEKWRSFRLEMCQDCELCVDFKAQPNAGVSFFKDDGCSQLMNDILGIVRSGAPYPGSSSPREILRDCFATFVLYLRFYTHLLLRTGVRFLLSCSHVASSLLLVLQWVVRDIVESVETNPPRAVALSCSVLAVLVAGLLALRIALKLVKMFIDDVVALTTDGKKRGNTVPAVVRTARRTRGGEAGNAGRNGGNGSVAENESRGLNDPNGPNDPNILNDPNDPNDPNGPNGPNNSNGPNRTNRTNSSNASNGSNGSNGSTGGRGNGETGNRRGSDTQQRSVSPLWLSLDGEPSYKGNGKGVAENWSAILQENEWIGELMMQCSEADDLNALLALLEQLHAGPLFPPLSCREGALQRTHRSRARRRVRTAQSRGDPDVNAAAERGNGELAVSGHGGAVADAVLADRVEPCGL